MTASLAVERADRGVRVNAVAPMYIETEMTMYHHGNEGMIDVWLRDTPMHRLGKPDEIASVVHFLASDASSLITVCALSWQTPGSPAGEGWRANAKRWSDAVTASSGTNVPRTDML